MVRMVPQHAEDILRVLRKRRIGTADAVVEPVHGGTINTVLRTDVGGAEVYVRIGPAPGATADAPSWLRPHALSNEAIVLDRVRGVVPGVAIPVAAGFGAAGSHWLVQKVIPGVPLSDVLPAMSNEERAGMWRATGSMLRSIHGIAGDWFGTPDGCHRFVDWPSMLRADVEGLLRDASRYDLDPASLVSLLRLIKANTGVLDRVSAPALVHSDLDPRHVFVERDEAGWTITGVIDWEYARYVDPWSESLLVEMLSRPNDDRERMALLDGYGIDAAVLDDPAFRVRQRIYRGIIAGWAATDAARLAACSLIERNGPNV